MIVVIPNAFNRVDGSFYENSIVSGRWDDYISKDLVAYVDSHYRTLNGRLSRGVAGHSMGGFGTLRLLMLHPDVFSAGYAMSPCCLDFVDDFTSSNSAWRKVLAMKSVDDISRAAANNEFWPVALAPFAISTTPDPEQPLLADLPYHLPVADSGNLDSRTVLVEDKGTILRWKAAMPLNMLKAHASDLKQIEEIGIDYGYEDPFSHIRDTVPVFAAKLMEVGVAVQAEGYHGDHNSEVPSRFGTEVLPFFAKYLVFEKNMQPEKH